ncbi:DUF4129 domain-containing protein [Lacunimicrobium album]
MKLFTLFLTVMLWLASNSLVSSADVPSSSQDGVAEKALSDFPWYDAKTEKFKPLTIPREERTRANSSGDLSAASLLLRTVMWIVIIGALVVLAVLIWRALTDLPPAPDSQSEPEETFRKERLELLPEVARGVTDFLGEAQAKANAGDFNLAMIYYFAWQLLMLDSNEAIELECGKTNRQYLREAARANINSYAIFEQSMRHFEDVLYGGQTLDQHQFDAVWQLRNQFRTEPTSTAKKKRAGTPSKTSERMATGGVR